MVRYCSANTDNLEAFSGSIQDRLQAMASAHGLLTQSRWEGADLHDIISEQLGPFGGNARVKTVGKRLMLRPKAALSISLAIHELATNAAKYGALSVATGWVEIGWATESREAEHWLRLCWTEHGGPPVAPPTRRGFGRLLLERSLAFDIDGQVELNFKPDGLACTALIPSEQIVDHER
jgi:chemotaxis family two-component system sensor kinase Cph1